MLEPLAGEKIEHALAEMATQIPLAEGESEAERAQLAHIQSLLKARACFIARHDPSRDRLQVMTVRGRNDTRISAVEPGEGVVGQAFTGRGVVRDEGMIAAPLDGNPPGVLAVVAPRYEASDHLMRTLCSMVTSACEVAKIRDDASRRTKDLQTAVAGLKSLESSRDELLSNVSHELKNPLSTIKMHLALLGRESDSLTEAQRRAVHACERNADRLLRLINDLLLLSRLQTGKMQLDARPIGLKALADELFETLAAFAAQSKVQLRFVPSPEVFVRGDRDRIREAITHLVENAIHRSPSGGEARFRIETTGSGLALIAMEDSGPPIPPELLPHLFDLYGRPRSGPFRQATELGLPVVARIAQLHGGRVEARSSPEGGASFQVYLPMFAGAVSIAEPQREPVVGDILLVEDDADCREVLAQVLEMEGYRVVLASSATHARSLLEHFRPALVLLDLRLSEEDGMAVLHDLRSKPETADIAVYIISGARDVASLSSGTGLNRIDGFFEKPLQVAKVLDTIASVVRPPGAASESEASPSDTPEA